MTIDDVRKKFIELHGTDIKSGNIVRVKRHDVTDLSVSFHLEQIWLICLEVLATPPRFGSKNTDGILNVLNDNGIIYIAILSQLLECTEPL